MMKLDRDDKVHVAGLAWASAAALFSGIPLKGAFDQLALENKIYECACYVITDLQGYGCINPRPIVGISPLQLCEEGGMLQRMQEPIHFKVKFFSGAFAFALVFTGIAIAILFIKPCARYREYQDKQKLG